VTRIAGVLALLVSGLVHVALLGVLVVVSGLAAPIDTPTVVLVDAIDATPPAAPAPVLVPPHRPALPPEPRRRVIEPSRPAPRVPPAGVERQAMAATLPAPAPERVVEQPRPSPPAPEPAEPMTPTIETPASSAMHDLPREAAPAPLSASSPASGSQRQTSSPSAVSSASAASVSPGSSIAALPPAAIPPGPITQTARPRGGYQVRPAYPAAARQASAQGTTMLRVHIAEDGRVDDVQVQRSAGHPALDAAAMTAVRQWQFEPARSGRTAVAMWVVVPFEFQLGGD
jgi:protein TonB